jgi:hypothetical protein
MFSLPNERPKSLPVLSALHDVVGDLSSVIDLPDQKLGVQEYCKLFPVGVPEAAFDELIYFLPRACEAIFYNPESALDCIDGLVAFSATCDSRLRRAGLKHVVQRCFVSCLDKWTQAFTVIHYNRAEMQERGSPHAYADYVLNSDVVFNMLSSLVRFGVDRELTEHYILQWSSVGKLGRESSGWFVEASRRYLAEGYESTPAIVSVLMDQQSRQHHFRRLDEAKHDLRVSQTYIRDVLRELQIVV